MCRVTVSLVAFEYESHRSTQPPTSVRRKISISQSAVTLCGWEVKAGTGSTANCILVDKRVGGRQNCVFSVTRAIPERLRGMQLTIKRYTNKAYISSFLLTFQLIFQKFSQKASGSRVP